MADLGKLNFDGEDGVIQNQEFTFLLEFLEFEVDEFGNEIPNTDTPIPFHADDQAIMSFYQSGKEIIHLERGTGLTVLGADLNQLKGVLTQAQTALLSSKFEHDLMIVNPQGKNRYYIEGIGTVNKTRSREL